VVETERSLKFMNEPPKSDAALLSSASIAYVRDSSSASAANQSGSITAVTLRNWVPGIEAKKAVMFIALLLVRVFANQEEKKAMWGPLYNLNKNVRLLLEPVALVLANFLLYARGNGSALSQRHWLPLLFVFWFPAAILHLWGIGCVYGFDLRLELPALALWVLASAAIGRSSVFLNRRALAMNGRYHSRDNTLFPGPAGAAHPACCCHAGRPDRSRQRSQSGRDQ